MADSIALRRCNRAASLHLSLSLFLSPRSLSLRSHSSRCCSHVPIFLTIFCGAQKFNRKSTHTRTRTHTHNGNISHTPPPPRMCWQPSSTLLSKPHDACPAKRRLFTFFFVPVDIAPLYVHNAPCTIALRLQNRLFFFFFFFFAHFLVIIIRVTPSCSYRAMACSHVGPVAAPQRAR